VELPFPTFRTRESTNQFFELTALSKAHTSFHQFEEETGFYYYSNPQTGHHGCRIWQQSLPSKEAFPVEVIAISISAKG
jgi:hypothetical protein